MDDPAMLGRDHRIRGDLTHVRWKHPRPKRRKRDVDRHWSSIKTVLARARDA